MERVDELDAIKDYLTELNRSAQSLQNANYHRSVLRDTSRKDKNEKNPFLRCIQMKRDVENQFRCIDLVSHSKNAESVSTSDDPSEGERQSRGGNPTVRAPQNHQRRKTKKTSQPKEGEKKKKDIRFSLENRSSMHDRNQCVEANGCEVSRYGKVDTQTRLIPCQMGRKGEEAEYGKMGICAFRKGDNEPGKSILCTDQRKEAKTDQTKQMKHTEHTAKFSNDRERELFQYLIAKANDEIENISLNLKKKCEEELMSRVDNIKSSYEGRIKKLSKAKKCLSEEKEQMEKDDKYNKEVIKKLEKKKIFLLREMEELKKKYDLVCNATLQKDVLKWNTDQMGMRTVRDGLYREDHLIRDYEKKINKLKEQLNQSNSECLSFKNMWEGHGRQLHLRQEEVSDLQREMHKSLTSKKEMEEKWTHLKGENFKMEAENDRLRAELKKAKLNFQKLEEDHADVCQNKDHLLACYKIEEKKLKEDVQNYKMKCALLENRNQEQLFEKKCKMLESALKDVENEKSICERICEKNENIQRDMLIEIKSLKNELYECRNKAYKISKYGVNSPQGKIFYGFSNEMDAKGVDSSYDGSVRRERESSLMRQDILGKDEQFPVEQDTTQRIKSIEKQLTLLKLERSNKEAELKKCPKHGGRTEEVRRRECLTKRIQCIDEKIKMLYGTLKMLQMSTGDDVT
ncbi:conserved Plasmodium protein, unknown function [Plasmodium knowlesi strain H]|uniref:Uncharacterized protein n=2 Tax=Plasmodium knowlesi TaxID=5850 RepID=A0A679L450_PLAKH|nr:conserved Plasmodium protein, unknown function [Plasmodium knowlesi strain H]OTN66079.1 Uncharacterized protein PKNOH_S100046700 [Plasmodium knowlesi]CAA9987829.1 conserved Plasmodium protein, unknown function [Plasmodium knowlesi strain H]VVS77303.1 conserved Plasmodium protein, unknown function [Plasmodium knowlesi strain H]